MDSDYSLKKVFLIKNNGKIMSDMTNGELKQYFREVNGEEPTYLEYTLVGNISSELNKRSPKHKNINNPPV